MSTFGGRLRDLRRDAKLTQDELAGVLHVNRATLANWEINRAMPDPDMLRRMADHLGVSVDYLLGRTNDSNLRVGETPSRYDPRLATIIDGWEYATERDKETLSRMWDVFGADALKRKRERGEKPKDQPEDSRNSLEK